MANSERVPLRTKFGYGTGHIMNDMCASMWFTYCLLFFNKVLEFDNDLSGNVPCTVVHIMSKSRRVLRLHFPKQFIN